MLPVIIGPRERRPSPKASGSFLTMIVHLQLYRPTAHVGRNSFVSISMNEKVSSELVAIGWKHKDPKTLMGYIEPSSMRKMMMIDKIKQKDHENQN